jgi:hypothetical protein
MTTVTNIVGAEWEARQPQKVLDAFDRLENLLKSDPILLRNLMNDDMDMEEELSYLDDDYADFTEDNRDWLYETMKVNLKVRYEEQCEEEEEEEGCGCGVCSRCVADDTCAAQCGDKGTITVVGKDGTNSLVCKDCCAWFKTQNEEAHTASV